MLFTIITPTGRRRSNYDDELEQTPSLEAKRRWNTIFRIWLLKAASPLLFTLKYIIKIFITKIKGVNNINLKIIL